ncbi:hypothetical protein HELRODRAFT_168812 [Helobdella robusta]|uniref:CARD domain-containing protein n=1 Tax=Helobdella robusta TaxID=6412 RepID=T1F102_HELRO|nr:hypothetical protein HELRODRAFT_168812 [Helobdella robusta]ESO08893.1 hypothetical protein HELRODRAFT_168812 [Helobdella robusta]
MIQWNLDYFYMEIIKILEVSEELRTSLTSDKARNKELFQMVHVLLPSLVKVAVDPLIDYLVDNDVLSSEDLDDLCIDSNLTKMTRLTLHMDALPLLRINNYFYSLRAVSKEDWERSYAKHFEMLEFDCGLVDDDLLGSSRRQSLSSPLRNSSGPLPSLPPSQLSSQPPPPSSSQPPPPSSSSSSFVTPCDDPIVTKADNSNDCVDLMNNNPGVSNRSNELNDLNAPVSKAASFRHINSLQFDRMHQSLAPAKIRLFLNLARPDLVAGFRAGFKRLSTFKNIQQQNQNTKSSLSSKSSNISVSCNSNLNDELPSCEPTLTLDLKTDFDEQETQQPQLQQQQPSFSCSDNGCSSCVGKQTTVTSSLSSNKISSGCSNHSSSCSQEFVLIPNVLKIKNMTGASKVDVFRKFEAFHDYIVKNNVEKINNDEATITFNNGEHALLFMDIYKGRRSLYVRSSIPHLAMYVQYTRRIPYVRCCTLLYAVVRRCCTLLYAVVVRVLVRVKPAENRNAFRTAEIWGKKKEINFPNTHKLMHVWANIEGDHVQQATELHQ